MYNFIIKLSDIVLTNTIFLFSDDDHSDLSIKPKTKSILSVSMIFLGLSDLYLFSIAYFIIHTCIILFIQMIKDKI